MDPTPPAKPPTDELLDQYLAGSASAEQADTVRTYLATPSANVERVLKQASVVYPDASAPAPSDPRVLWEKVSARIASEATLPVSSVEEPRPAPVARKTQPPKSVLKHAMAGVLTVGALVAIVLVRQFSAFGFGDMQRTRDEAIQIVTTRAGQQEKIRLPDGSVVVLAPGSRLQYTSGPDRVVRDIALTGEALFTVTSDTRTPFVVRAGHAAVRVLGTTFVVRRHANESSVRVVVAQGKVSVAGQVLANGDAATVEETGPVTVSHGVDISSALAWTTGTLVFDRTPLREVIAELERWYGVRIVVTDSELLNEPLTMTFLTNAPDDTFTTLATLIHARIVRDGNQIILIPGQQNAEPAR